MLWAFVNLSKNIFCYRIGDFKAPDDFETANLCYSGRDIIPASA